MIIAFATQPVMDKMIKRGDIIKENLLIGRMENAFIVDTDIFHWNVIYSYQFGVNMDASIDVSRKY